MEKKEEEKDNQRWHDNLYPLIIIYPSQGTKYSTYRIASIVGYISKPPVFPKPKQTK